MEKAYLVAAVVATVISGLAIVAKITTGATRPLESSNVDQ
jgi:hypothetical protein